MEHIYRAIEAIHPDGTPFTEDEIGLAELLIDGGYDITDPSLADFSIAELLPRIKCKARENMEN